MQSLSLSGSDVEQELGPFQVAKKTLNDGLSRGVEVITIRRGKFAVQVLPTRGMNLYQVTMESGEGAGDAFEFGWDSPVDGPVHPSFVPLTEPGGLGWLDGFDELFVRCGVTSNGAPVFDDDGRLLHPLHGRVANLPARNVSAAYCEETEQFSLTGEVTESRFHFGKWRLKTTYTIDASSTTIKVSDQITNFGGTENSFQMLYHYNLGKQLLEPGGTIYVPCNKVVPRNEHAAKAVETWNQVEPPTAGFEEMVYFFEPKPDEQSRSLALLVNKSQTHAAGIRFSPETLPCFSLWENFVDRADGYVVGLEPGTNFPNPRGFEEQHGRTVSVGPGETQTLELELVFADSAERVLELVNECQQLQADESPMICGGPEPDWCA